MAAHPLVRAVLDAFPGATIAPVRERFAGAEAGGEETAVDGGDAAGEDAADTREDEG